MISQVVHSIGVILKNLDYSQLIGAFVGSFSAFIFSLLFLLISNRLRKLRLYLNTLFNLEVFLSSLNSLNHDNLMILNTSIYAIKEKAINRSELEIPEKFKGPVESIKNVELINHVISLNIQIRKLTADMNGINKFSNDIYTRIRSKVELETHEAMEINNLFGTLELAKSYTESFSEEIFDLITKVKLLRESLGKNTFLIFFRDYRNFQIENSDSDLFKLRRTEIKSQLQKDIVEDKKRISEIIKKTNTH